jgi:hypothetical protein
MANGLLPTRCGLPQTMEQDMLQSVHFLLNATFRNPFALNANPRARYLLSIHPLSPNRRSFLIRIKNSIHFDNSVFFKAFTTAIQNWYYLPLQKDCLLFLPSLQSVHYSDISLFY